MIYTIVPMAPCHIDGVVKIENECFSSPWTKEGIEEELHNENSHFLVSLIGEEVAGYIGVQEICGESYITNIGVLPEYRRKGIAKSLLLSAITGSRERKCEFITLEVRESNFAAISLYESLNFERKGKRKNFYTNPAEDGIIYTLEFTEA